MASSSLPWGGRAARLTFRLLFGLTLIFLVGNVAGRFVAIYGRWPAWGLLAGVVPVAFVGALRARWTGATLTSFGASFFLYGFHSYRVQNQAFELLVATLALALLVRGGAGRRGRLPDAGIAIVGVAAAYVLLALGSLLLIPPEVLRERVFLEGSGLVRAVLEAFPYDPLYPFAAVDRMLLLAAFAGAVARQADAERLFRCLFRGVAWAAVIAVVLGLLDFSGILSLDRYNLARLFYGADYRRLQATFGNPSWFACFVAVALPFVLLELWEARRAYRGLAAVLPLCAAGLFLSGARAAWLAALVCVVTLVAVVTMGRRASRPLPPVPQSVRLAFAATVVGAFLAALAVYLPARTGDSAPPGTPAARLPGLASEMRLRGLGTTSPRTVAARYALELAREAPLIGLGHETFNLHLRAQMELPSSGVAGVAAGAQADDRLFDDTHNTYLQVLVGTGALGLGLWLLLAGAGLLAVVRALRREPRPVHACVLAVMIVFHFYGLFQGMQYVPVTWCLYFVALGWALTADDASLEASSRRMAGLVGVGLALLVVAATAGYWHGRGYRALKQRFGVSVYLPDEAASHVGFYRPEQGPAGPFRWMQRRGVIHVSRPGPVRLLVTCDMPALDREPLVVSLRFEGRDLGNLVFRRPGTIEWRSGPLGTGTLRLEASRTFRPAAGQDRRERSVAVSGPIDG